MNDVFDLLTEYCKSLPDNQFDTVEAPESEVKPKKYNKGWKNIEIANRKREVERGRRELGL
jgi:hypothetical protein